MLLSFGSSLRIKQRRDGGQAGAGKEFWFGFGQEELPGLGLKLKSTFLLVRRGLPGLGRPLPPASCFSSSSLTTGDVRWMVRLRGGSLVFLMTMAASPTDWMISYLSSVMACRGGRDMARAKMGFWKALPTQNFP